MKKHTYTIAGFLILPLVLYLALEIQTRCEQADSWFNGYRLDEKCEARVIITGNSLAAAAILAQEFQQELCSRTGKLIAVTSFARAHCEDVHIFYGLKRMLKNNPKSLSRTLVIIESIARVPYSHTRWAGQNWYRLHRDGAIMLSPMLDAGDLRAIVSNRAIDYRFKCWLLAASISPFLSSADERRALMLTRLRQADSLAPVPLFARNFSLPWLPMEKKYDMLQQGGIQVDEASVRHNRQIAFDLATSIPGLQVPEENWDATIVHSIVELVRSNGGEVAFFDVPVSDVQASWTVNSPVCKIDRHRFREACRRWNCVIVHPDLRTRNIDYPDVTHISTATGKVYTAKLAEPIAALLGDGTLQNREFHSERP